MSNIREQIIRKGETKTPKRTSQLASERLKHGSPFRNPLLHISFYFNQKQTNILNKNRKHDKDEKSSS